MSKAPILFAIQSLVGLFMIMGNKDNPTIILLTGILMICGMLIFQATLSPMTNMLSYFMSSKEDKIKRVKKVEDFFNQLSSKDIKKIIEKHYEDFNDDGFFDGDVTKKVSSMWDAIDEMERLKNNSKKITKR